MIVMTNGPLRGRKYERYMRVDIGIQKYPTSDRRAMKEVAGASKKSRHIDRYAMRKSGERESLFGEPNCALPDESSKRAKREANRHA